MGLRIFRNRHPQSPIETETQIKICTHLSHFAVGDELDLMHLAFAVAHCVHAAPHLAVDGLGLSIVTGTNHTRMSCKRDSKFTNQASKGAITPAAFYKKEGHGQGALKRSVTLEVVESAFFINSVSDD